MNLGAFGFWLFWAVVVLAWTWWANTKRKTKHETLSLLINKGDTVDPRIIENLLQESKPSPSRLHVWLMVFGLIILFVGVGMLAAAPFFSQHSADAKLAALVFGSGLVCASLGFISGSIFVRRIANGATGVKHD